MTFGEKLKSARLESGLRQSDLAKKLETTGNTVSNWETNLCKPDLDTLSRICNVLHVNASYFLPSSGPNNEVSFSELRLVEKYRELDSHGREMVDFTLQKEWERSVAACEKDDYRSSCIIPIGLNEETAYVNAAHADDYASAPEDLRRQEEDIMDDEDF